MSWGYLVAGLVVAAAIGGAYFEGMQAGRAGAEAEAARDERLANLAGERAAAAVAQGLNNMRVRHVTVQQQLETQVRERQVFVDCRSGPDAVRLFNSTIPGAEHGPAGAADPGQLPAAHPADG